VTRRSNLAVALVAALLQACSNSPAATSSPQAAPTHSTATGPQPVAIDACKGSRSPSAPATSKPSKPSSTPGAASSLPLLASIPLPMAGGVQIATGFGALWLRLHDGSVARIDPVTNRLVATIGVGRGEFGDIATGEGSVWVTTFDEDKLTRIDPATNRIVAEVRVGTNPEALGFHRMRCGWRITAEGPSPEWIRRRTRFWRRSLSGQRARAAPAESPWSTAGCGPCCRIRPRLCESTSRPTGWTGHTRFRAVRAALHPTGKLSTSRGCRTGFTR
jgi:hypothetical protein